jgi:hypothetical protein
MSMENEKNIPSIYDADAVHVANAMLRGGGFLTALSLALIRADRENRTRILDTWNYEITKEWEAQYPEIVNSGSYKGKYV